MMAFEYFKDTDRMFHCYLVMNGETPVAVYEKEKDAESHAESCRGNGFVMPLIFHREGDDQ